MKLENGMFVICPKGVRSPYLTPNKKYEVSNVSINEYGTYCFNIKCDDNFQRYCIIDENRGDAHLNGKRWIIDNNKTKQP